MSVLKIIYQYPTVFEPSDRIYTTQSAIQLIASCNSKGTDIQKISFEINEGYLAINKLFKLGLRMPAVELCESFIQKSAFYHEYNIAAEIAKHLVNHYYVYEDLEKSNHYRKLYEAYNRMNNAEFEARQIFNQVIYNFNHGLDNDQSKVSAALESIEKILSLDSVNYHAYFYQCKCYLSEGDELKRWIETAIEYFKNVYFRHDTYIGIFKSKLVQYHINARNNEMAKSLLSTYCSNGMIGNKTWLLFMYSLTELLINEGDLSAAAIEYERASHHPIFQSLAQSELDEWALLRDRIYSGSGHQIHASKT